MDTVSIRLCQRHGCAHDLDALGLKSTARFCSPDHRREQGRLDGDGKPRKWVPGKWVQVRERKPRSRPRNLIPGVDLTSPVISALNAAQRASEGLSA